MANDPTTALRIRNSTTVGPIARAVPLFPDTATADTIARTTGQPIATVKRVLSDLRTFGATANRVTNTGATWQLTPLGLAWLNGATPIAYPQRTDDSYTWAEPDDQGPDETTHPYESAYRATY